MSSLFKTCGASLAPKGCCLEDGVAWERAEPVRFSGTPLAGELRRATVRCLWNDAFLFVRFDVDSCKLHARVRENKGDNLWLDDGVEILVDALRHRSQQYLPDDFAYHINILNAVYEDRGTEAGVPDPAWIGRAQSRVHILGDTRYAIEAAIPWEEIGLEPLAHQTILGVDFCVNGSHPETWEYDYFDWCGLAVFHDPSGFADLILQGA